jgi:hypothetical protein
VGWSDVAWAVIVTYKDSVVGGALTTGVQGDGRVVVGVVVVVRSVAGLLRRGPGVGWGVWVPLGQPVGCSSSRHPLFSWGGLTLGGPHHGWKSSVLVDTEFLDRGWCLQSWQWDHPDLSVELWWSMSGVLDASPIAVAVGWRRPCCCRGRRRDFWRRG